VGALEASEWQPESDQRKSAEGLTEQSFSAKSASVVFAGL